MCIGTIVRGYNPFEVNNKCGLGWKWTVKNESASAWCTDCCLNYKREKTKNMRKCLRFKRIQIIAQNSSIIV